MAPEVKIPNLDHLIERYQAGASINQLAREVSVSRSALARRFRLYDIELRGQSEATRLEWQKIKRRGQGAINRQVGSAWKARRGSTDSMVTKIRRAKTAYENLIGCRIGEWEAEIAAALSDRWSVERQFPIGPYNVDLAIQEALIAVEVESNRVSTERISTKRERLEYLFDRGWRIIVVCTFGGDLDLEAVAQKIHSVAESASGDPSFSGQYGVIDRQAKPIAAAGLDRNGWTRIQGLEPGDERSGD